MGIALAALVAVGAGISWYVVHHSQVKRNQAQIEAVNTPGSSNGMTETKPNAGTPATQTVVAPLAPKPVQGESSGAAKQMETSATRTLHPVKMQAPAPQPVPAPHPISKLPSNIVNAPTPAFAPVTPTTSPRKGVLHYAGPPVPFGGTVVFNNLPKDRLRFNFDRGAWQPLIHKNPDGTQTLTLHSIKHEVQTSCDVGWEIAQ